MVNRREILDIIWNISLVCPWDCKICCVDAVHVNYENSRVKVRTDNLKEIYETERIGKESIYDQAAKFLQETGRELNLVQKLMVVDNLRGYKTKINFSGGDPLVLDENLELMRYAVSVFGKDLMEVSTTGVGLSKRNPEDLKELITKLDFSYDATDGVYYPNRPEGYNNGNLKKASLFSIAGIHTVAETPLSVRNIDKDYIFLLYENLNRAEIDEVKPMRLFPVGRNINKTSEVLSREQYLSALDCFYEAERRYLKPKLRLQCSLKHLKGINEKNPCDLFRESFAVTPDGLLLTSAWAYGLDGKPLNDVFVLGSIVDNPIGVLLNSERGRYYQRHIDDNFGHCKIFAFLNSQKSNPLERVFDKADPLYSDTITINTNQNRFKIINNR